MDDFSNAMYEKYKKQLRVLGYSSVLNLLLREEHDIEILVTLLSVLHWISWIDTFPTYKLVEDEEE